ncbi:uncharacterized protein C8A04DRAFT_8602 [Dichotomopilus funicola]|uniref:Uncharacterized protein n=1 Tax=Dichotomopilus funicola TaxID=1934379 RepID=A0AAN6VBU5_9PEZI|nr:hypothetical protein C8A04DRAFT_8602 [Dichotomopilus funicola]
MAGRPTRWIKEQTVLKPAPQDVPDSDWPCYVLRDATIYRKDGETLANPLLVHLEGPLVIRGIFDVDDVEEALVSNIVKPNFRTAKIEIPHSERYSIGYGPLTLWGSGAAGWFEIRPSFRYQRMYDQAQEAISLYYSALEVYERHIKACKGKKKAQRPAAPTLDDVFFNYALRAGNGIVRDEVEALCSKWADFLIPQFDKEAELDWTPTKFAKWLRKLHPDVQKRLDDIARGVIPPLPPPPEADFGDSHPARGRRSRSARASSESTLSSRDSGPDTGGVRGNSSKRPQSPKAKTLASRAKPKISETPVPVPEKYRQLTRPAAAASASPVPSRASDAEGPGVAHASQTHAESVNRLLGTLQEIAEERNVKKSSASSIRGHIFFRCKIRNYHERDNIIAFYAKDLLPLLDTAWNDSPMEAWLKETSSKPWEPLPGLDPARIPEQTQRRTKLVPKKDPAAKTARVPPAVTFKASVTAAQAQIESDWEDDEFADLRRIASRPPPRNQRSGKGATLRLATSSKKRPRSEVDDQSIGSQRGRKSTKVNHSFEDEEFEEDTSDEDVSAVDQETAVGSQPPLPEGVVRVVVHAERVPTSSPKGADGTWTCEQEGCTYVVRSADEHDSQEVIQAHFRDHEAQADKINLAVKESRGHMPIKYAYFPPILLVVCMHGT